MLVIFISDFFLGFTTFLWFLDVLVYGLIGSFSGVVYPIGLSSIY